MIGIILVAHGDISRAFLDAAGRICGSAEGVRAIGVSDPIDEQAVVASILETRKQVDQGDGVVVVTDMFGGTPSNICLSLVEETGVEVLTGMNLPMVLKLVARREHNNLRELARMALDCGRDHISSARDILKRTEKE